jgi:hypothetical protein
MTQQELIMEAAKLRLRFRMNSRLKLESQALLSKLFREHGVPLRDELLASLVFAVPHELVGEAGAANWSLTETPPSKPPTGNKPPSSPTRRRSSDDERVKNPPPRPPTRRRHKR